MYFAFRMIQIVFFSMVAVIVIALVAHILLMKFFGSSFEITTVLSIAVPPFGMALTFMFGYLYATPANKRK